MFGFSKVNSISPDDLAQKLQQNKTQLIDVREVNEFRSGHIKGARNIPLSQIDRFSTTSSSKIYVICQSGMRSKKAYKILEKKGLDVTNVMGGMSAWKGKTVRG
ncbi:rhodanese-like domain-containing protein [Lactococcus fujiensis]|uniref:Rhodanese-related sulfurtransferase n=1 Tax=Lactococcus fujiensis JCM 16395 TaxID=1291764 RepID=A0A2A5RK95_9LACT|nr:rhodanese-like domain-containing protein [Lactococcus fujiensis]PCR99592.1 rhodanese-related sulfurtransferase [Lactococcus fujiensis JCM 16395]